MSVGLPPMTIESASALYAQAKNAGADSLLIMAGGDERNLASVALRALVMMGDRVVELEQIAVSRDELLDEMMATIRAHIDSTLPPAEHIVPTSTTWRGTSEAYFANVEEINAAIARTFQGPDPAPEGSTP